MARCDLPHLLGLFAGCSGIFAAVSKAAALDLLGGVSHHPLNGLQTLGVLIQLGNGVEQPLGIGVALRGLKDILCCAVLDGLTGVHNHDLFAGLGHNTQIVGDEDHGGVQPLLQFVDQAQHLGLNGHIQCSGGFVGKDQLRLTGQRNGNDNALLHAAGKLMGVLHLALCRDAHQLHHLVHTGFQLSSALLRMMDLQHLHDLGSHGHHRVQGRHGILEDHGYYTAAHGTDLFLGSIQHMALENLTVLDLTRVLAGPFCTMMLADMGANVIKIEVPKGGDDTRSYPPFRAENLNGERESVYFANINRNKKGITLNLKAPEGKEIFKELVKKADIVVENYRPGVMDKLGLGYDVLKEINPRIIYAAVSGFGCYGPYHLRPGYDILAQAMGGMMSITGSKGGEPTRAGSALGDILGGLHVTIGILAAVNARTITGKGQRVDVSLMDSMIAATENTALKYIETGNIPAPMGNRYAAVSPYDSFTCKGGKVIIAAGNQKLYEKLCNEVLERPDMITDPRFVDMPGRLANQDAIAEVIEERIKDLTPNEAAELVLAHGIPAGPIMNIKEILDDPHVKEREMFVEMDHPTLGKVTVNGCAIKLMDTKPSVRTPAPQLGQNNRDIFEGVLGMTEEQFNTLHEKQVF